MGIMAGRRGTDQGEDGMSKEYKRNLLEAQLKFESYAAVPYDIIYGGLFTILPLLMSFLVKEGIINTPSVGKFLIQFGIIYVGLAFCLADKSKNKLIALMENENKIISFLEGNEPANKAGSAGHEYSSIPIDYTFHSKRAYEEAKLNEKVEFMIGGSAIINIASSILFIIFSMILSDYLVHRSAQFLGMYIFFGFLVLAAYVWALVHRYRLRKKLLNLILENHRQ